MKIQITFLAFVLIAILAQKGVLSDPFDGLTAQEKTYLANNITGGQVQITFNGAKKPKGIIETIQMINTGFGYFKNFLRGLNLTSTITALDRLAVDVNAISSFEELIALNATIYNKFTTSTEFASSTVQAALKTVDWTLIMLSKVDNNNYVPNLDKHKTFWLEFATYLSNQDSALYTSLASTITQAQINAIVLSLEIPDQATVRANLMSRVYKVIKTRPSLISEFEKIFSSTFEELKWTSDQFIAFEPIVKDMTCKFLRQAQFIDYYNYITATKKPSIQTFEKLCECSLGFVYNATRAGVQLDNTTIVALADNAIKYMYMIGLRDPFVYIETLGAFLGSAPATTLETILNLNQTSIKALFKKYNVKQIFQTFTEDWRKVIGKAVARYFNLVGATGWDSDDLDMFITTALYMPIEDNIRLMDIDNNYRKVLSYTDSTPISFWKANCFYANLYFDYLANKLATTNDTSSITNARLKPMLVCKESCDFGTVIKGRTISEILNMAKDFLPMLKPEVLAQCKQSIAKYLRPSSADIDTYTSSDWSNLYPYLPYVLTPSEIQKINSALLQANYDKFASKEIDSATATELFKKLASTTPVSTLKNLLKGTSFDYLMSLTGSDIVNNIVDFLTNSNDMDLEKLAYVINKYLKSSTNLKLALTTLFQSGKSSVLNLITLDHIRSANIKLSDIPESYVKDLPKHLTYELFKNQNVSMSNIDLSNCDNIKQVINGIDLNDISKLTSDKKLDIILKLLKNSASMNSAIRKKLLRVLIDELKSYTVTDGDNPFKKLTDSMIHIVESPEFFAEIGSMPDVLTQFTQAPAFKTFLLKFSQLNSEKCETFSRSTLRELASATITALGYTNVKLTGAHLDKLGRILVSSLPIDVIVNQIDPEVFAKVLDYFKTPCFQLKAKEAVQFSSYLSTVLSKVKFNPSKLGELLVYVSTKDISSLDKDNLLSSIASILREIEKKKDTTKESVQQFTTDFSKEDNDDVQKRIKDLKNLVKSSYESNSSGKRKRQTSATLTCSNIGNLDSILTTFDVNVLKSIPTSASDFKICLTTFGNPSYNWDSTYLNAFYQLLKKYYADVSTIPTDVLSNLGAIACQLTTSELSSLNLASNEVIYKLGKLKCWSQDQMNVIASKIKTANSNTVNNYNTLNIMGNFLCGIQSTDVNGISRSTFTDLLPVLSNIDAENCGNLKSWYQLANTSLSGIADRQTLSAIGVLAAGMPKDEFKKVIDGDNLSSLTKGAFKRMPAENLNQIPSSRVAELETSSLVAILNSVEAASLSSDLIKAAGGSTSPTTNILSPSNDSSAVYKYNPVFLFSFFLFALLFI